jgi:hypothetical protein
MGMNTQWQGLTADSSAALRNDKQKGWATAMVGLCALTDI